MSAPDVGVGVVSRECRDHRWRHEGIRTRFLAVDVRGFRFAWSVGMTDP